MSRAIKYKILTLGALSLLMTQFQNCSASAFESKMGTFVLKFVEIVMPPDEEVHNPPDDMLAEPETTYAPILADRYVIQSILQNIFGPSALSKDSVQVYYNAQEFGGPCSIYIDHKKYNSSKDKWEQVEKAESCSRSSANLLIAQINSTATVTRQGLLNRTCSDLTSDETTFSYALNVISGNGSLPEPTEENIKKLVSSFYQIGPEPSQEIVDSLKVMFPLQDFAASHWRNAIYTVCVSSHWQVL